MSHQPLLLDIGPLSCACTDHALEEIYKAKSDLPDDLLWRPHEDPFLRDHIEAVTQRGLLLLSNILHALLARFGALLAKATEWEKLDAKELAAIEEHLRSRDPAKYTVDDWMLLVDWIVKRYLPPGVIASEAEYLAVKSTILGRIEAAGRVPPEKAVHVASAAPTTAGALPWRLSEMENSVIEFARARAAEFITDLGDRTRHRIKQIIVNHEQLRAWGDKGATLHKLESQLLDEFAVLNRDWRRIALTESARDVNEGFIASLPAGTKVKRIEAYEGACTFCRHIHGRVFTVVPPDKEPKDGATEVWIGKTNMDRSASPRKRVGDELVERTPEEMWWPAAGVQHPNCRGTWQRVTEPKGVDPEFVSWMDELLKS